MTLTIIIIWLVLWTAFLWMVHKLPANPPQNYNFGWWCIGIMIALIIYLPLTIGVSKIIPSCPPQIVCPSYGYVLPPINWEQKYNQEVTQKEKVLKKYPRVRKYFK